MAKALGLFEWLVAGLSMEVLSPSSGVRALFEIASNSAEISALLLPNRMGCAATQECRNKLQAYRAFSTADQFLHDTGSAANDLVLSVNAVSLQEKYFGIWSMEGLGYYLTTRALDRNQRVRGSLFDHADRLPAESYIPLHTGMGLGFARQLVLSLPQDSESADLTVALEHYLRWCRESSLVGYEGATMEALGLITRLLRPALLPALDRQLRQLDIDLAATFWHGVGRALYFSPWNILPCSSAAWPVIRKALTEPPDKLGQENALSGLGWALALVNVRHPEVLELFIRRHRQILSTSDSFADGVAAAAAVWHLWDPSSRYLQQICEHQPGTDNSSSANIWGRYARKQCQPHFLTNIEEMRRQRRIGEIFQVPIET